MHIDRYTYLLEILNLFILNYLFWTNLPWNQLKQSQTEVDDAFLIIQRYWSQARSSRILRFPRFCSCTAKWSYSSKYHQITSKDTNSLKLSRIIKPCIKVMWDVSQKVTCIYREYTVPIKFSLSIADECFTHVQQALYKLIIFFCQDVKDFSWLN